MLCSRLAVKHGQALNPLHFIQGAVMNTVTPAAPAGTEANADEGEWRILLADDHAMVREALAQTMERLDPNLRMSQARNVDEARELLKAQDGISLVLLDYNMPGMSG